MGEERDTAAGQVVYLLAELGSGGAGAVHEIGARARVLDADGDRLILAIDCGDREDVVTCRRGLVAQARRSLRSRRRVLRSAQASLARTATTA
jgi:hypothetical protein